MTTLNLWDFFFGFITTFGIYVAILVIKFLLDIENLFSGEQDSVVCGFFFGTFLATFCIFHISLSLASNKWHTACVCTEEYVFLQNTTQRMLGDVHFSSQRFLFAHRILSYPFTQYEWFVMCVLTSDTLLTVNQQHHLFLGGVLVFSETNHSFTVSSYSRTYLGHPSHCQSTTSSVSW